MQATHPGVAEQDRMELVGYHDLERRPAFKIAMQEIGGRWFVYLSHFWHSGWTIVDVTDPSDPQMVRFVEGPPNTETTQIQVAEGRMLVSLERPLEEVYGKVEGHDSGIQIYDVKSDPSTPYLLGSWKGDAVGTHRNFYAGGDVAYLCAKVEGWAGQILVALDVSDPHQPRELSRWWWPGQHLEAGEEPTYGFYFHGPAYVEGTRAYLSYGRLGAIILDVSDPREPRFISRIDLGDLGSRLGCHSAVPIPERDLLVVNSEAILEGYDDPLGYAVTVDISDETRPRVIGWLPRPQPARHTGYRNYQEKGGRYGPHNQAHHQRQGVFRRLQNTVLLTYFNAGLRVFDIEDPYNPNEVGYFVPEDPRERLGAMPRGRLVSQTEDVVVDARGYIYCTDKNHGLFILRYEGELT